MKTLESFFVAVLLLLVLTFGTNPSQAAAPANARNVGTNLNPISYFSPEQPFLNVFKMAGASNTINGWITSSSAVLNTNEEGYLPEDSDGYVTSLKASPTPPGGQVFTFVQIYILGNLSPVAGVSQVYPGGSYTLQFQGAGTISMTGGDVSGLATSTPGVSVSGTTITSTMSPGAIATVTFNVTPSSGLSMAIMALPNPSNYIKSISIVQSAYQSNYQAGEIFHPRFKAMVSSGYSRVRFMDWMRTNFVDYKVVFTGPLAAGATSGTISQINTTSSGWSIWPFYSGTYNFVFGTGQIVAVTATYGSAHLTWTTPLTSALPVISAGQAYYSPISWSTRPLLSNATWATNGVPIEALVQLCNEAGVDGWFNIGGTAQTTGNFANSLAQLLFNGTGAVLTGSNLTTFTGLGPSHKAFIEYMNEYWNPTFVQFTLPIMLGTPLYGENYPEWYGSQMAGIGDAFYSVYGAQAFSSRVVISMSQQATNTYELQQVMNTPDWSSRAYTHHIGQIHTGGYFGIDNLSSADFATLTAMSPADQVNAYFALAYSNVYQGTTFSSMPSIGYIPQIALVSSNDIASVASQPWGSLPHVVYEGGSSNTDYLGGSTSGPWTTLTMSAHRDPRTQYLYYDPTHQLSSAGTGFFPAMAAAGISTINVFTDVGITNSGGDYGVLESIMQNITPLASAPPKYQGVMSYIGGSGTTTPLAVPMAPANLVVK